MGIDSLQASLNAILVQHLPLALAVKVVHVHAVEGLVLQIFGKHLHTCSFYVIFTDKILHKLILFIT